LGDVKSKILESLRRVRINNLFDEELFTSTRLPRQAVQELIDLLYDDLERKTERSHAVPVDTQVLAALQFYSSGSFQWMLGHSTGLSEASVSRVITGVTDMHCASWPTELSHFQ